ncbi:hypothetical protein [Luteitalea sp. TBR-22]|uniref:hypothetical protein n=1 Tax=Luteitalea sp. TBR-22 TaxID=2802971 RepID=UPI001EF5B749|nr:hypothetical protein [Luteitalea sp. TBR-22]
MGYPRPRWMAAGSEPRKELTRMRVVQMIAGDRMCSMLPPSTDTPPEELLWRLGKDSHEAKCLLALT